MQLTTLEIRGVHGVLRLAYYDVSAKLQMV